MRDRDRRRAARGARHPVGTGRAASPRRRARSSARVWDGDEVTVGSLGDSRAYWIGADGARRLTVDDSWAREQVDAGVLDERDAEADPRAHAITRWLGADAPDEPPR